MNLEWRQVEWADADNMIVFDDQLGFVKVVKANEIKCVIIGSNMQVDLRNCYYINNNNEVFQFINIFNNDIIASLFSQCIYSGATNHQRIDVTSVVVTKYYTEVGSPYNIKSFQVRINQENLSTDIDSLRVWTCDEIQNLGTEGIRQLYQRPLFLDLKVGQYVFSGKKCLITKVYEQPDINNRMIDVQTIDNTIKTISFSDQSNGIYKLPYQSSSIISECDQFNICKNEIALSPYAEIKDQTVNIYWLKIADAAEYIISFYKYINCKFTNKLYSKQVYHMKDYLVGHNEGFISVPNLTGGDYIVVVKAENRSGDIIAQSRGIGIDFDKVQPRYTRVYHKTTNW